MDQFLIYLSYIRTPTYFPSRKTLLRNIIVAFGAREDHLNSGIRLRLFVNQGPYFSYQHPTPDFPLQSNVSSQTTSHQSTRLWTLGTPHRAVRHGKFQRLVKTKVVKDPLR